MPHICALYCNLSMFNFVSESSARSCACQALVSDASSFGAMKELLLDPSTFCQRRNEKNIGKSLCTRFRQLLKQEMWTDLKLQTPHTMKFSRSLQSNEASEGEAATHLLSTRWFQADLYRCERLEDHRLAKDSTHSLKQRSVLKVLKVLNRFESIRPLLL